MKRSTPRVFLKNGKNKKLEAPSSGRDEETKPVERSTLFVSVAALVISIVTLYIQSFYEKHELVLSFIEGTFGNDSVLTTKLIFHNKGNQHATILGNKVVFHNAGKDPDSSGVQFTKLGIPTSSSDELDPVVLSPGQQFYREYFQKFNLKKYRFDTSWFKVHDTIKIAINVGFINSDGRYSSVTLPVGWVFLDSAVAIESYRFDLQTTILKSDQYFVSNYRYGKK